MDIRAISVPEISLLRSLSRRQWFLLEREKNWLLRRRAKHYREAALLIFHAGHYVDLMVRKQNWRFLFFSNNKTMSITMLHHDAHCTLFTKKWKSSIGKKKALVSRGIIFLLGKNDKSERSCLGRSPPRDQISHFFPTVPSGNWYSVNWNLLWKKIVFFGGGRCKWTFSVSSKQGSGVLMLYGGQNSPIVKSLNGTI